MSASNDSRSNYRNPARPRKEFPRFSARLAPEVKEALAKEAYSRGMSVTKLFEDILKSWLSANNSFQK